MKTAAPVAGAAIWERSQAEKASVFDTDIRWFKSNRSCHRKRKGQDMFRKNVSRRWFEIIMVSDGGETSTFRIEAETEEAARLLCKRERWKVISCKEMKDE